MYLELAGPTGNNETLDIPYENKVYTVKASHYVRLNDYEFSGLFDELLAVNPLIDPNNFISERDKRRAKFGLPPTNYTPGMSGKFGSWLNQAGKEIKSWFQGKETNQTVAATLPDGSQVAVQTPIKTDSPFVSVVKGIAGAFGFYTPPPTNLPLPQTKSTLETIAPYAMVGIGALVLYKVLSKK